MEERVIKLLEQFAQTLGTTVDKLLEVLMQQVQIEISIATMWVTICGIIIAFLITVDIIIGIQNENDAEDWLWSSLIVGAIALVPGIVIVYNIQKLIILNGNPEYWVFKELLALVQ